MAMRVFMPGVERSSPELVPDGALEGRLGASAQRGSGQAGDRSDKNARLSRASDLWMTGTSPKPAHPLNAPPSLDRFSRIVVKVGSSLLVDRARGALKQ